ncbi:MAG: Glycerophosphoryl diester phosphodiesterase, partial [uncultured Corynebacteriales bacterium]
GSLRGGLLRARSPFTPPPGRTGHDIAALARRAGRLRHGDPAGDRLPAVRHRDPAAGLRPPRRVRLPPRAHPGLVRAGDPARRRRDRARPGDHEGRAPGGAARAGDLRHHRRDPAPGVRRPADHQERRRRAGHRLVHRGLHPARAAHAAGDRADPADPAAQHPLQRPLPGADLPGGHRPGQAGVPAVRPEDRDRAGDQAPDVLPGPGPAAGAAAGPHPGPQRAQPAQLRRLRAVLRGVEPGRAALPAAGQPGPADLGPRGAVRLRRHRGPADVRRPGLAGRAAPGRPVRRRPGAGEDADRAAGPGRRLAGPDHAGPGRAPCRAGGRAVHVPQRERLPAGGAAHRHRPRAVRQRLRRVRAVLPARRGRPVQRQRGHRGGGPGRLRAGDRDPLGAGRRL